MSNEMILAMNLKSAEFVVESDPRWIGVCLAEEVLMGYDPETILHAGPPISYRRMCEPQKRSMRCGAILEGFAHDESEAEQLLLSGKIKVDSAMNYNAAIAGAGVITRSMPLAVVEDSRTGRYAGVALEGGGFDRLHPSDSNFSLLCEHLSYLNDKLFAPITNHLCSIGGLPLADIIRQGVSSGDDFGILYHNAKALFLQQVRPLALAIENGEELLSYLASSNCFFQALMRAAAHAALLGSVGTPFSTMVTAAGGNGVEFGIKIASLGDAWFTAPSPLMQTERQLNDASNALLPWIGDCAILECAGLGSMIALSTPSDRLQMTREMQKISIRLNTHFRIPALDFDHSPVGIDIMKVVNTGILPIIKSGAIDTDGVRIGEGYAKIPLECFENAMLSFAEKYGAIFR